MRSFSIKVDASGMPEFPAENAELFRKLECFDEFGS
jgi:hypothetical protein